MIHVVLCDHHDTSERIIVGVFDNKKQAEDVKNKIEELFPEEWENKEPIIASLEMNSLGSCFIHSQYQFLIKDSRMTITLFDKETRLVGGKEFFFNYCNKTGSILYVSIYENITSYSPKTSDHKAQELIKEMYKTYKDYLIYNI